MKYQFRFTKHAQRQLRATGQMTALGILTAMTPLGDDPYRDDADVKELSGQEGLYRIRVGDYRVIYEIHGDVLVILVVHVGNRRDVYLTPAERTARAEQARAALREWNSYDPTEAEQADMDAELDRRLAESAAR